MGMRAERKAAGQGTRRVWHGTGPRTISRSAESGPLKTRQKVSGRLTSDDVTQDRLDIRSYIDTAGKHGLGALEVLEQLMLGYPWMPQWLP